MGLLRSLIIYETFFAKKVSTHYPKVILDKLDCSKLDCSKLDCGMIHNTKVSDGIINCKYITNYIPHISDKNIIKRDHNMYNFIIGTSLCCTILQWLL